MTPYKYLPLCLALFASASAEVIFTEDYETEAPIGTSPYKASALRPEYNEPDKAAIIVGASDNLAGSGKAIYLLDLMGGSSDSVSLEYDFADSPNSQLSAFRIDFGFAKGGIETEKKDRLFFGAGEFKGSNSTKMNAVARRFFQVEFIDTGRIKFNSTSGSDSKEDVALNGKNTVSIFVNDYDSNSIQYTHPITQQTISLGPNMVAYYLNGEYVLETNLDLDDKTSKGTVGTSENNFGRMGFYSSTTSDNNAWVFDDLKVTRL